MKGLTAYHQEMMYLREEPSVKQAHSRPIPHHRAAIYELAAAHDGVPPAQWLQIFLASFNGRAAA